MASSDFQAIVTALQQIVTGLNQLSQTLTTALAATT
jgi:hypothetical protein